MSRDDCFTTQLIDKDGEFNAAGLEDFVRKINLAECGLSYAVVAIMGPQSSGMFTCWNHFVFCLCWLACVYTYHLVCSCILINFQLSQYFFVFRAEIVVIHHSHVWFGVCFFNYWTWITSTLLRQPVCPQKFGPRCYLFLIVQSDDFLVVCRNVDFMELLLSFWFLHHLCSACILFVG